MTSKLEVELDQGQVDALQLCMDMDQRLVIVTGAAGTGKTTIQREAHARFMAAGYRVSLVSPTGKAARRQTEATGVDALTIHKFLEFPMPGEIDEKTGKALVRTEPQRRKSHPVEADVVIVDEYTMVPHILHRQLIDALPSGAVIRIFGDRNQLRPVETDRRYQGLDSPFEEMVNKFPTAILEVVHRQAADSEVLQNAHRVLKGFSPRRGHDFRITLTNRAPEALCESIDELGSRGFDFGTTACQVLSPTRKRWTGTYALNELLQKRYNSNFRNGSYEVLDLPRHKWEEDQPVSVVEGDKVIWTKNDYNLGLMNGQQGIILECTEFGDIIVKWDIYEDPICIPPIIQVETNRGDIIEYDPRKQMDLAWCITTHKSQGSEYDAVIYVTSKEAQFLLWRGNFYTAMTRAKRVFEFIGDQRTMQYCVQRKHELQYSSARNSSQRNKK